MGLKVNKAQLEEILGVSHQALTDWQKEGMPIESAAQMRGQENRYDTEQVIKWMLQREVARQQVRSPKDQLDVVRTKREELALRKDLRELVDRTELRPLLERFVQDNVALVRGLADKYAPLVHQVPDLEGKHQLLKGLEDEILTGLGDYEFCCADPSAGGGAGV